MRIALPRRLALLLCLGLALPPATMAAASGRHVELSASDGVRLAATYWSPGAPGPGVILLHMCNSSREAWYGLGPKLAARGLHVLALDYRGYGGSAGVRRLDDFREQQRIVTELWPGDVDAAFSFLAGQPGVERSRIGAAGGSCGVNQAVQLARRHPEVKVLALLAGNTNREGETFLEQNSWLPILTVAADDDGGAVEMMEWLLGFSTNPENRRLRYADGGHGTAIFPIHPDLEPAIVDWFVKHLISRPVVATEAVATPTKGPSAALWASLHEPGGAVKARERLRAARAREETLALPPQAVVNLLGYDFLRRGDTEAAIGVFRLNAEAHPTSANTYDSLADAYLAAGNKDLAREFAQKAIQALPGNPNQAPAALEQVRAAAQAKLDQLANEGH